MRNKICTKENPCSVLLVEDELSLRDLFRDGLFESGERRYRVLYAESLAEMKAICDREEVEAIILDLGLGETFGLQTLSQALLITGQKIPIGVLTGRHGDELEEAALEMGAQFYCEKLTISQASLLKMVRLAIAGYKPYLRLLDIIDRLKEEAQVIQTAESEVEGDGKITLKSIRERITALAKAS
jgi:DNA-binding response OmpR family regulator